MSRNKVERKYNPAQYDTEFESIPINRRRCIVFLPDSPNEKLCHCNRTKDEHPNAKDSSPLNEKWQRENHTIQDPTKEQSVSLITGAPYVRCDIETDPVIIERVLLDIWRIPRPALLMQITGGHKYFKLRGKMDGNFLDDFVKFVCKSNTWLLTNGTNVGIVQLIGQAIRKRKLTKPHENAVAIGVCNYGCIKNLNDFQRSEHMESFSLNSVNIDQSRSVGDQNLEMNHTHFILLDDGTIRHYDIGDYRTRLTNTISNDRTKQALPVPAVTLLFEGDEDSVRSIYNDLRQNIPVIIVHNTGRIADYLIRWLSRTQEMDFDTTWLNPVDIDDEIDTRIMLNETFKRRESLLIPTSTNFQSIHSSDDANRLNRNRLRIKFEKYYPTMNEELFQVINGIENDHSRKILHLKKINNEIILMILYCLQPIIRSKISIFNYNKKEKLSEIILQSICQSIEQKKSDPYFDYLLELALDWNCINTAKEWIVQDCLDNIDNKKSIFCRALIKQRYRFVHYFIQLGLELDEIFFDQKLNPFAARNYNRNHKRYNEFLKILYTEEAINREDWLLRDVVKTTNEYNRKVILSTDDLNELFRILIGGYMKSLYYDTQIEEQENRMGIKRFRNIIFPLEDIEQGQLIFSDTVYKQLAKDYIIRDLFLWAIVMNYMNLAKVFISYMKNRICGALIAIKILSYLRDTCSNDDKKIDLTHWINYFEQYAINCIDLCYQKDSNMAQILIIQRVEIFGDVTCLQIANDANSKRFVSHPCCRQVENSIWYDKLYWNQFHLQYYIGQLISLWTLGLLAPFFARFRTVHQNSLPTEPILQSYGINYCDPYAINHFDRTNKKRLYQIYQFHQSLHVKFTYHHMQYMAFLFLFSYILLFHFDPINSDHPTIHPGEILVIIIVCCMFIEEIRIFFNQDSRSLLGKCYNYFRYFFKQLYALAFLLFYIGLILRFQAIDDSATFQIARILMGYDLWIWWMGSLSFFIVNPFLGPYLISIGKMLKNLSFFVIFISIIMTAYGFASRSIAFYGTFEFSIFNVFHDVFYPVYYLLYTHLSNELEQLDEATPASRSFATHILLAFHMLLINILLVNLLIAMFNKSFQDVESVQSNIWNYQQYAIVREYYDRSPLFIPFSTIFDIIALIKIFYQWYLRVRYNYVNPLQRVFKMIAVQPELELVWQEFESTSTYAYAQCEASMNMDRTAMESEMSMREMRSSSTDKNEKDSIRQLRNEFKTAIKDLRNDIRLLTKSK